MQCKAVLETDLSQLFKKLTRLSQSLKTIDDSTRSQPPKQQHPSSTGARKNETKFNCLPMHEASMREQLNECIVATSQCCTSLFDLSLLVPSAPWVT